MFKTKIIKNFISGLLIIAVIMPSVFFFTQPKKAEAQLTDPVNSVWQSIQTAFKSVSTAIDKTLVKVEFQKLAKDILKEIGIVIARKVLQKMTQNTVNWINSGFHGNPFFLENSDSFFKDIAKSEIKNIIDMTGYNSLRFPFGKSFALQTIDSYKRQLDTNLEYSLSRVMTDPVLLNNYRNDFNVGGWNGFLINTQYPQNNYIGYHMLATEELARRLAGTTQNAATNVKETLEQGQGFLSPKTCPSNPDYNNLKNEFQKPAWNESEYIRDNPPPKFTDFEGKTANPVADFNNALSGWEQTKLEAMSDWDHFNTCPGGLVTTTPGSVIANATMEALNTPKDNVIASMVTGSLATIFDALLNKFIDDGLNSLAKKINPQEEDPDDWDYYGNTLGTVTPYGTDNWGSGADIEIVLSEFQTMVEDGIADTIQELDLLDNADVDASNQFTNPGLLQMLGVIWPKIKNLDMCTPGPDIGWEDRLQKESERNSQVFMKKLSDTDGAIAAASQLASNELNFAVKFFKDWISNKMLLELPNSVIYLEAVAEIEDLHQLAEELITRKRTKTQTLARLQSIQGILNTIQDQPAPDTADEKKLIEAWKQYSATRSTIANPTTINNAENELLVLQEQYARVDELLIQCEGERTNSGWSIPNYTTGGANSVNSQPTGNDCKVHKNFGYGELESCIEKEMFCSFPAEGGYPHSPFNTNLAFKDYNGPDVTHPEIPLLNAARVIYGNDCGWRSWKCDLGGTGELTANIKVSCDAVYNATPLDYKGNIPGVNNVIYRKPTTKDINTGGGQCADTGNKYTSNLRSAMNATITANPTAASLPNIEDANGKKENARAFLVLVAQHINNSGGGMHATAEVKNGNNNPSTGDIIGIWKDGDTVMERYDAILGDNSKTVAESTQTNFDAFIPLNCTASGGGNDCGCQLEEVSTPEIPPIVNPPTTPPTDGTPYIASVSPTTATAGTTVLTITGSNFSTLNKPANVATVRFYFGLNGRSSVDGTVSNNRTAITVTVPAEVNTSNTTIKIYRDGSTESNPYQIQLSGGGANTSTPPASITNLITKDLGPGSFPDVAWFQNRLYVAFRSANNLAINLYSFDKNLGDQKTEKIFTLSTGAGGFPRMTVSNNTLWLAYRDGEASGEDIKLWRKDTGVTESLGPAVGNDPVAVGNDYIAWQKCEGTNCASSKVYRRPLLGGTEIYMQNWQPTGISRILPTGSVVMIDTDRTAVSWGLNSWYAGKLTVTTDVTPHDDNGIAVRINNLASSEFNLWLGQMAHTPHAATDNSGNYAVTTWNPTIRIATFTGPI